MLGQSNNGGEEFLRELLASQQPVPWGSNLPRNPQSPPRTRQTDVQLIPTQWDSPVFSQPIPRTPGPGFTPQQIEMLNPKPAQPAPHEEALIRALLKMKSRGP